MGRTKRKRLIKNLHLKSTNLNHEKSTINLRKWLKENGFTDLLNLQLRTFPQTGRGITSKITSYKNDVLVRIPLDLMITFDTVEKSGILKMFNTKSRFNAQTLMSIYLAMEKHKGNLSEWKYYINTLPDPEPFLPWMCKDEDIEYFPGDLKVTAQKLKETFNDCFLGLRKRIDPTALCFCCKIPIVSVLNLNLFKWAYALVNTRAVYLDPKHIISKNSQQISILSDEPSMALCPFLDMFNHSDRAETKVTVVCIQGRSFYELRTMTGFKKYEQFFISYGSHDNEKLLMEYGFFIPDNVLDCVRFSFKEVVDLLKLTFDERQYRFTKTHGFSHKDIYVGFNGVSFNFRAILFIGTNPEILNYGSYIFSDTYPSDFNSVIRDCIKVILGFKLASYQEDYENLNRTEIKGNSNFSLIKSFVEYRVGYIKKLIERGLP